MEPTSSGQARRRPLRTNNLREVRESGSDVPVGTAASARSTQALRGFIEASAIYTLIRQRPPTPLCRGLSPYCGENSEPGRCSTESLTSNPELENSLGQNLPKWYASFMSAHTPIPAVNTGCSQLVIATLYLKRQDGVFRYGPRETPRIHFGREGGAVGSLATRRVFEGDWSSVWQAFVIDLCPYIATRRNPSGVAASFSVGVDAV